MYSIDQTMAICDSFSPVRLLFVGEVLFIIGAAATLLELTLKMLWRRLEPGSEHQGLKGVWRCFKVFLNQMSWLFVVLPYLAMLWEWYHPPSTLVTHANTPIFAQERKLLPLIAKDLEPLTEIYGVIYRPWSMVERMTSGIWIYTDSAYDNMLVMRDCHVQRWIDAAGHTSKATAVKEALERMKPDMQHCQLCRGQLEASMARLFKNLDLVDEILAREESRRKAEAAEQSQDRWDADYDAWQAAEFASRLHGLADITHSKERIQNTKVGILALQSHHESTPDPCAANLYTRIVKDLQAVGLWGDGSIRWQELQVLDLAMREWM